MSDLALPLSCEQFELAVSDYIDGALIASDRAAMNTHATNCASCVVLLHDIRAIVHNASTMNSLSPSRDLWTGIAERLDTTVVAIGSASVVRDKRVRTVSFRLFAAAAALLVTVSSGITYLMARGNSDVGSTPTTVASVATPTVSATQDGATTRPSVVNGDTSALPVVSRVTAPVSEARAAVAANSESGSRFTAHYAARVETSTNFAYEREITAMRRIVDERLGDLDSVTVVEIERNLRIIDKAVNDSRRALQNDPRSRFLSKQLDRALETKLDIMRRIALL